MHAPNFTVYPAILFDGFDTNKLECGEKALGMAIPNSQAKNAIPSQ
jgi:hypothetical protein